MELPLLATRASVVAAAALSTLNPVATATEYATPVPPIDTPPRLLLRADAVRLPSAQAATARIPIVVDEPVRLDISARGRAGVVRSVQFVRRAGGARMLVRLYRHATLVQAFDRGRGIRVALQVVATDADGQRDVLATSIGVRAPKGYVPSTRMLSPMPGYAITSGFGPRWGRTHTGLDIPAPTGTAIRAARSGVVTRVGSNSGYGLTTIVDHGPYVTFYAHQSSAHVRPGQRVERGEVIGAVGTSGSTTGAHLHFEVHVGGTARDPMRWLS